MNNHLTPALFLCSIFASFLYKRYVTKKYLFLLMNYKQRREEDKYMRLLSSLPMRAYFSSATLQVLKIKYFIDSNQYSQVKKLSDQWMNANDRNKELTRILMTVYAFYLEYGYQNDALNLYTFLIKNLEKGKHDSLRAELDELKAIYIDHDQTFIHVIEEKIEGAKTISEVAVLNFRLAKLYEFIGEWEKSRDLLEKVKDITHSPKEKKILDELLQK